LSSPTCQYPLLPEAVAQEWTFCVADSVPVALSGSDLKAHLIVNPLSICRVSRLWSPSLIEGFPSILARGGEHSSQTFGNGCSLSPLATS
jgi:hypothetical protein